MGKDSPPHLSPNLQIKMPKRKSRSEMGLLNTLQFLDFESALTFVSCLLGLVLCFPFATEFGVFVVYFLDYIVGSAWWVIVLHLVRNNCNVCASTLCSKRVESP